ncbi:armadillo-type protein [Chlamydoabsidia padenii]|nr:armadillo-type protein [Chlamydoabsidia padenii]
MNIASLLDHDRPLDVGLLDTAVQTFYTGDPATQKEAERVLTALQNHPDTWQQVASILETSKSLHTKFLALRILNDFITVRWNTVPLETRLEIRNYIVQLVIHLTSTPHLDMMERTLVTKLNMVLIQILKKDWLQHWITFIPEIVSSSQTNLTLCENNLRILKLLSEEVFDYSEDQMTLARTRKLKAQMKKEAGLVFDLCQQVLTSQNVPPSLMETTLATLSQFLVWLPHDYVVGTRLVSILGPLLPAHRILVLECFTTIVNQELPSEDQIIYMYETVMIYLQKVMPLTPDFVIVYQDSDAYDQEFVHRTLVFITAILSKHLNNLAPRINTDELITAYTYLLQLSRIDDQEMWKICLEYWDKLTSQDNPISLHYTLMHVSELRQLILDRMAPPDEVLLVEDDDGEVTKQYIKEGDTSVIFNLMKRILSALIRLDPTSMVNLILERLSLLVQTENWTWIDLNRLCWAIGITPDTMNYNDETTFLGLVLEHLVRLLEASSSPSPSEASYVVTSCLVHICNQFIVYMKNYPQVLDMAVTRLFNYMHDSLPGVRDMACYSFKKICQGCTSTLANQIIGNHTSSILWVALKDISNHTSDLDVSQVSLVYEAVGLLIASLDSVMDQNQAFNSLTSIPFSYLDQDWNSFIKNSSLVTMDKLRTTFIAIKMNHAMCRSATHLYEPFFYNHIPSFIAIYQVTCGFIQSPDGVRDSVDKRACQKIKIDIHKLVEMVFSYSNGQFPDYNQLHLLLQTIMEDYHRLFTNSDSTVLDMMTMILRKSQTLWPNSLDTILCTLFEPTVMLINQNFSDYPDHRQSFFMLLNEMVKQYFDDLLQLPPIKLTMIVDSLLWGIKHTVSDISHVALQTCLTLIESTSQLEDEDVAGEFYRAYYLRILTEVLTVLVDPDCQNGFELQSQLLARMLELIQEGEIYTQVFDPTTVENPLMSNSTYIQDYVQRFFNHAFPLLQKDQTKVLVLGMFEYSGDIDRFQSDLLDFIIDIRQVDDVEAGIQRQQEEHDAQLELLGYLQ